MTAIFSMTAIYRATGLALVLALVLALAGACSDDDVSNQPDAGGDAASVDAAKPDGQVADSALPDAPAPATCKAGSRDGPKGSTNGLSTIGSVAFNLRTPTGYDPQKGHPLIVVYAAAGGTKDNMETFTKLTAPATAAGYIIAYVNHVSPVNISGVTDIAGIPAQIAKRWCVDARRIYLTGHSDGGSVIYVMLARKVMTLLPAAIAPSAAGLSKQSLTGVSCLAPPLPVMVVHSKNDGLFPGYGSQARDWWVTCNGCAATPGAALADGCVPYIGCAGGAAVQYCETAGAHSSWATQLNSSILAFFKRFQRKQ